MDRRGPIDCFPFVDAFLILVFNVDLFIVVEVIRMVLLLLLVMKVLLAVACRLLFCDNLLDFLVCFISLSSIHQRGLSHLDLVLVLKLLLGLFIIILVILLVLQLVPHVRGQIILRVCVLLPVELLLLVHVLLHL